jgi:polyketide biosynthesis enoyl-CoA hydratase PksI
MGANAMSAGRLVVIDTDGPVVTVRLCDAAGRNALSRELSCQLEAALSEVAAVPDARVMILAGLPEYFCTGANRDVLEAAFEGRIVPRELVLPRHLLDVPVPVIAAMEGHAIGGGLALALCADLIVAARESWYSCNFIRYGFTPGMGTTALLGHVLGPTLAAEMLFTGRNVRGRELEAHGRLNAVVPRAGVLPAARALADQIAEQPATALQALKTTLSAPKRQLFEAARGAEILMHELTFRHPETGRRIRERDERA